MKKNPVIKQDYQNDVLDLMRKIVEGVQLNDVTNFDDLTGQDRIDFLKYCSEVVSNPWFEQIFRALYLPHISAAALQAENYDIVTFHRATVNGVSLVREFFHKQNRRFHEEFEPPKTKFAPDKPFNPTEEASEFFKV